MDRRAFLQAGVIGAGGLVASSSAAAARQPAATGPYGSLDGIEPDANGVILPEGFTSRVVGIGGETVEGTDHEWHVFPDGAATFDDGQGGWFYACNSEVFSAGLGGVSAVHFDADGKITAAYPILTGSIANCAGGPTPWGTWLSCEEDFGNEQGLVWECDPSGASEPVSHPAMGRWAHEAAAVDPVGEKVYMTQDHPEGLLYRYTPTNYPDLSEGLLEAAILREGDEVLWEEVPDPSGASAPTRTQVEGAALFNGGEGIWYHDDWIYFCTKGDNRVHAVNVRTDHYEGVYTADPAQVAAGTAVLSGVDNITVEEGTGDLFVAEDGGNMEIVTITPDGAVSPFLRVPGQDDSEITGPCFNPAGDRLYFSSQRGQSPRAVSDIVPGLEAIGNTAGITWEISGPFRGAGKAPSPSTTTTVPASTSTPSTTSVASTTTSSPQSTTSAAASSTSSPATTLAAVATSDGVGGGNGTAVAIGVGAAVVLAAGGAIVAVRNRSADGDDGDESPGS